MYAIAIIRYRRPLEEVLAVTEQHRAYLRDLKDEGVLVASGPMDPRAGGILLVSVPDDSALRLNGSWSIEFWAKQVSYPHQFAGLIAKGSNQNGYSIWADPWGGLWLKRHNAEAGSGSGAIVSTGYRYFVVTYDGTNVKWYVDGVLKQTTAESFPGNGDPGQLQLGKGDVYGNNDIDEVALYATALNATRIAAHYASGH